MLGKMLNNRTLVLVTSLLATCNAHANNSTGTILFPLENETKTGNLLLIVSQASDPEGIQSVDMRFANSDTNINICANNCSTALRRPVVGINPLNFAQQRGSLQMELVVTDIAGTQQVVDTVNFNWQPPSVSNVTATRQPGTMNIAWDAVTNASRYNLYLASEPGITPSNINSKTDAQIFRSLQTTSQQILGFVDSQGAFALVTAVDRSGESAFSEELRIPALNNQLPEAQDDSFATPEDTNLQGNVLTNDSDPEGSELTASVLTTTSNGSISLQPNGNFNYQPNANFSGTDSFSYQVLDEANGVSQANVVITIAAVNDAPEAVNDEYSLAEDTALNINAAAGLLSNDSDIDVADQLTVSLVSNVSSGSLNLNQDGSFSYQPAPDFFGLDSFTYQAVDTANATATATVSLNVSNVNDLPQANDDSYQTLEDTTLVSSISVLANDTDADIGINGAQELTASLLSNVSNGTLNLASDGSFVYQPNNEFSGADSFTYQATDSAGAVSQATASIVVTNVNDAPITSPDSYSTNEDTALTISAQQGVLANDSDPDSSGPLTASIASTPSLGSVSLSSDGSFSYTPNANAFGQDSFSYNAMDAEGLSTVEQVQITIVEANDPPVAIDDQASTGLNQSVTISVLANDQDPDNGTLTVTSVSASAGNVTTDGTVVVFTPENNFFGIATINYTISNDSGLTASAQVNVAVATGIAITANDDTLVTNEDTPASVDVLANDSGTGVVTVSAASANSGTISINSNGSLTYTPAVNFNGSDTIDYTITDSTNQTDSTQVSVTINAVNDAPVAIDDAASTQIDTSVTINVLANDSDAEGDPLTLTSATADTGSVSIDQQQLTYTPATGFSGQANITYIVSDNSGDTDSGLAVVTVSSSDLVANNDSVTTLEDTSVNIDVLANDTGDEGLRIDDASVNNGSIDLEDDNTLTYTPAANFFGIASFTYFVSDNSGGRDSATVTVNITSVNDGPNASPDTYTLTPSQSVNVSATQGVLKNDSDIESDSFTATVVSAPSHSNSFTLNADGSFTYQHDGSKNKSDSFTYKATETDGTAGNTTTVTLNIANINTPAMLCNIPPLTAISGEAFSVNLQANNPDNDNLTYTATGLPAWLTLVGNTLSGTPTDSDITTTRNITLKVTDELDPMELNNIQLTVVDNFGSNDIVDFSFGSASGASRVRDMAIDRNGKIVVVGSVNDSGETIAVARFNPNGTLDTSFNGDGIYTLDLANSFDEQASAVVIDKNNHILISAWGSEDSVKADNDFYLIKLTPSGSLDSSFSGDGRVSIDIQADKTDQAYDLVLHTDGDITLVGHTQTGFGNFDVAMVHINPDGSIDTNFGNSGILIFNQTNDQFAKAALLDHQGHIYVVGSHDNSSNSDVLLLRTTEDGLDNTFNNGTGSAYNLSAANDQFANDIIFSNDGGLLVAGTSNDDFAIYTFNLDASQVPFLTGAQRIEDIGDTDVVHKILSDKQGGFFAVGISGTSTPRTAIIKLNEDGSLDSNFASNGVFIESTASGNSGNQAGAVISASGQLLTAGPQADNTRLRYHSVNDNPQFSCNYTSLSSNVMKTVDELTSAAFGPNREMFFAGKSKNPADDQTDFVVFKTSPLGVPDINFANSGILRHDYGSTTRGLTLTHVVVDSNNAPYLVGYARTDDLYIAKYTNDGSLDSNFNGSGVNNFGGGDVSLVPKQALLDSSNNLYIMGTNLSSEATVMKFTANGGIDLGFANGGNIEYSDSQFTANDMTILSDGSIFLIGKYTSASVDQLAMVKYSSNGILDTSFGTGGLLQLSTSYDNSGISVATNGNQLYILTQKGLDGVQLRKVDSSGNPVNNFGTSGVLDLASFKTYAGAQVQYQAATSALLVQVRNSSSADVLLNLAANSGNFNSSFINAGVATATHNLVNWESISGFVQADNNKYVVFGTENDDMAISVVESNGRISNEQSEILLDAGFGYFANAITLDPRAKIVVAGEAYNSSNNTQNATYARFDFDGSGAVQTSVNSANQEKHNSILVAPTTQIYTAGQRLIAASPAHNNIIGFRTQPSSATIDSDYASGGFNLDLSSGSNDKVNDQVLLSDGSIIMVGSLNGNALLVKLDPSGALDTTFNSDGFQNLALGESSTLHSVTLDAAGKLIAVGETTSTNNTSAIMIRVDANTGNYDNSFDTDGIATLNLTNSDKFMDVAVTPLGNYVAVGTSGDQTLIAQFKADGTAYTSFNSTGYITNDLGNNDIASAVTIDNYGAILVATQTSESAVLLRYDDAGTELLLSEYYAKGNLTKINDLALDHHGNAYLTGHIQEDQSWKLFVIKFNSVASPF